MLSQPTGNSEKKRDGFTKRSWQSMAVINSPVFAASPMAIETFESPRDCHSTSIFVHYSIWLMTGPLKPP
ncbi:MAG: hypothetical protein AAGJ50_16065, partial [Pseudomonadota bacterium]